MPLPSTFPAMPRLFRAVLVRALAVASALLPVAGTADVIDIAWTAGRFERTMTVPAGNFAEACGRLAKGDRVAWRFEAGQPLDFNIHYHLGKDVVYPVRQEGVANAQGTLVVPLDQDYCWMWSNRAGVDVRATVALSR